MRKLIAGAVALLGVTLLATVHTPAVAGSYEIDMEGLPPGTIVYELDKNHGVSGPLSGTIFVFGYNPSFGMGVNAAVIFDSANPTGGDTDLGTPNEDFGGPGIGAAGGSGSPFENSVPLGNVLIIAENLIDGNGDDLVDDPDDADLVGQGFRFDFTDLRGGTATVNSLTYMDVEVEQGEDGAYILLSGPDIITSLVAMPPTGNNGVHTLDGIGISGVSEMLVVMNGSGAIEGAAIDEKVERPCWVTTGGFQNAGVKSGPKDCTFGGNIGPPSSGAWEAVDHNTGDNFHTNDIHITFCESTDTTGPQQPGGKKGFDIDKANFECTGRLNGVDGYTCEGFLIDGGEPAGQHGNDPDRFELYVSDESDQVVFQCVGDLDGGNVQIHPPVGKP